MVERQLAQEIHDPAVFAAMTGDEIESALAAEAPQLVQIENTPEGPSPALMCLIGKLPATVSFFIREVQPDSPTDKISHVGELWPRNSRPY